MPDPTQTPQQSSAELQAISTAPALVALVGAAAAALVLVLVPRHEGTVLHGYRDIAGVVTACVGHTRTAVLGRRYTPQQCQALLVSDLVMHAKDLACITHPLKPHEKAALLSFALNVGPGQPGKKDGLCWLKNGRPSTLRQLANAGDMPGACAQLSLWTGVRGRDCAVKENRCGGIPRRRADERALCEGRYLGAPA
jgi:lysozyme